MKPGGQLKDIAGGIVFVLAAGNVFVYTVKTFKTTYTRPPLGVWQKGAGETPSKGSGQAEPDGKGNNGDGGGLGKSLLEAWDSLPIPGIKGGFLGGSIG
jgi:hypothetical protein